MKIDKAVGHEKDHTGHGGNRDELSETAPSRCSPFYAYAYPTADGFADYPVKPEAAYFDKDLGEFLLPYSTVQRSDDPRGTLMAFLQSTYEAAAETGDWDRDALECSLGKPRVPRPVDRD